MALVSVPGAIAPGVFAGRHSTGHQATHYFVPVASLPLAYFVTFRCYGTWLHGDERGSFDKRNNAYDTPGLAVNADWQRYRERQLKLPPVHLDAHRRAAVEEAVRETCEKRGWYLHALAVRTNHVHAVVGAREVAAEAVLNALKSNATRVMRARGYWTEERTPWSQGGSTVYVWKEKELQEKIEYVVHGQGDGLQ